MDRRFLGKSSALLKGEGLSPSVWWKELDHSHGLKTAGLVLTLPLTLGNYRSLPGLRHIIAALSV